MARFLNTVLAALALAVRHLAADDVVFDSTTHRVSLVELYTSEGCSSCPPAEEWFSKLKGDPRLWKDFVPVAFHVDYWDGLGWPDRFARKAFTARQQAFAAAWGSGTVYTPGFVLNGKEWQRAGIPVPAEKSGVLKAALSVSRQLTITYKPASSGRRLEVNIALLGFSLSSEIRAGENSGRHLQHDFVALSLTTRPFDGATSIPLPAPLPHEEALAIWVTEAGALTPVQATGGWLK